MPQVSEQQKKSGLVKYHELKRPLTKDEKKDIKWDSQSFDIKLEDRFQTDLFMLIPAVCCTGAVGAVGLGIAQTATTIGGALLSFGLTIGGFGGGLLFMGILGYDAFRYFFDRHRRIRTLQQAKIEENTRRDSKELWNVRVAGMEKAKAAQAEINKHIGQIAARRKAEMAQRQEKPTQVNKPGNKSRATTRVFSRNGKIFVKRDHQAGY